MPVYLYQCDVCGVRFERTQRFSESPLTECPECDGHVHRVVQPVSVVFKGSGFYVTDNRQVSSPTLRPPKEAEKRQETEAGGAPETQGESEDTKPAAEKRQQKKDSEPPTE